LVELGAAPGALTVTLARQGYEVTALDLAEASDAWGDQVEGTMERAFAENGIAFTPWNLEETPYPYDDGCFDIALLTEVVEHLRDYPLQALTEISRILRPRGVLLLTTPNAASPQNRVRLALGRSVYTPLADWMAGVPHARHAREYTLAELRRLLESAGFEVRRSEGRHFHTRSGRTSHAALALKRAIDRLGRVRPTLAPNLAVLAWRP
jgi:2-polyprenyl-3-methyl-5-hydroxy-6-metoxy-1,4-benzoquinol methylase